MIGPRPCAYACAYVDPVFTSQSYDIGISTSTRRTNLSVFLALILTLCLCRPSFHLLTYVLVLIYALICVSENQTSEESPEKHLSHGGSTPTKGKATVKVILESRRLLFGRGPNRVMETACFDGNVQ